MTAQAGAAGGSGDGTAGGDEDLGQALGDALHIHLLGGGDDDATDTVGYFSALQDLGGDAHIRYAAVGAGADDHLVDGHTLDLVHGLGVGGEVRQRDGGLEGGQVDGHFPFVLGVGVGLVDLHGTGEATIDVVQGLFVHGENAVLAACLDGHVGDGEAVVHGQLGDTLTRKLDGLIKCAVHADHTDEVEDHVLTADVLVKLAHQVDLDGGGHLEPVLARDHAGGHVGGANTRGEGTQRAVGAGVGVCADDTITGADDTLFGKQGVLDAHLTHVVEVGDVMLFREIACGSAQLGGFDVLTGGVVVEDDGDLVFVEHAVKARLFKNVDSDGGGDVVAEDNIQLGLDEVAGFYRIQACVSGEDLLCHGHAHGSFSFST